MSSEQAAAALGVRLPTLYAYVSRGKRQRILKGSGFRVSDAMTCWRWPGPGVGLGRARGRH